VGAPLARVGWGGRVGRIRLTGVAVMAAGLAACASLPDSVRVVDGDTIEIGSTKHRLHGIDAPERGQKCETFEGEVWPCGLRAGDALQNRIGGREVRCQIKDRDRFGRMISVCFAGSGDLMIDLNGWMVLNGWAVAYRRYALDYVGEEERAKAARRGIWSGVFVPPWAWRKGVR